MGIGYKNRMRNYSSDDSNDEPLLTDGVESVEGAQVGPPTVANGQAPKGNWKAVLPVLILYMLSGMPLYTIRSQYLYKKVQEYMNITLNINHTFACNSTTDPEFILQQRVQAEAANWNMYIELSQFLPSLIMTVVFGVYSDYIGRRITFILPPIGAALSTVVNILMIRFNLPIWCFFFEAIEYLFGGMYAIIMGGFAYIADTSPPEKRATRMTALDAAMLLCASATQILVGYLIQNFGFLPPLYFVLGGKGLTILYAIFFVPESLPKSKTVAPKLPPASEANDITGGNAINRRCSETVDTSSSPSTVSFPQGQGRSTIAGQRWAQLKHGFLLYIKDNGTGRRWKLLILLLSYMVGELVTTFTILTLFEMNSPLCWGSVFIGYFTSISMTIKCVAILLVAFLLRRCLAEEWIAVIARIQSMAEYLYLAFVNSTLMMFFAPVIGATSFMAIPMTRAMMSKLVSQQEQGSLFAVMTCGSKMASLISSLTVNKIYASTLFIMEGFVFLVGGFCALMSLSLLLVYIWKSRKDNKDAKYRESLHARA